MKRLVTRHRAVAVLLAAAAALAHADEDAAAFVQFVQEPTGNCVNRGAQQVQVKNTHASRRIRVWLDRTLDGRPTADRSRTELAPGAEPEPLGCSRDQGVAQAWRVVRAQFVD